MEQKKEDYRISFFKPSNPQTRANRNMVLWLLLVWVLAVFGFHVVLKIIEKPTPEPALLTYDLIKEDGDAVIRVRPADTSAGKDQDTSQ